MNIPSVYFEIARHFITDKKDVRQHLRGVHIRVDEGSLRRRYSGSDPFQGS